MFNALRIFLAFIFVNVLWSQNPYPQDYFRNPLDIPIVLSGSFAELRSNHFHAGLDLKTRGTEGLKVFASADGYVSRIKISHYGYGKALYITHPNGYTTVYAHLQKFAPKIEAYIKSLQYQKESFEVETFPKASELLVKKNDIIGYSGNTGGSAGPHLHFEIRDDQERPLNPMLFGIKAKDTRRPRVTNLYVYPRNAQSYINGKNERQELRLIPIENGEYVVEKISAIGEIGFGIVSYDQQDLAPNKNGLSNIATFFNGTPKLEVDFKRFGFYETKHLNRYIDYEIYIDRRRRIQKLFLEKNNPLSLINNLDNNGYCKIEDSTSSIFRVEIKDFNNNTSIVTVPITGQTLSKTIPQKDHEAVAQPPFLISENATTSLDGQHSSVTFYPKTVYEDVYINYSYQNDTLKIDADRIPLQQNFEISYNLDHYKDSDKDKLYVAKIYGRKQTPVYVNSQRKGNRLIGRTKTLGTYTLVADTEAPEINPVNFQDGKWLSKYRYLKLNINDSGSGISAYRATVNGKWILMEYDYKTGLLVHDFNDGVITDTANNLKVIVTDNVGNSSTFEAVFYRK
jgi:hypothetical protein